MQLHKECIYNHNNISLTNYKGELIKFVIIFLIDSKYYLHHKHMSNVFSNSVHLNSSHSLEIYILLFKIYIYYGRGKFLLIQVALTAILQLSPRRFKLSTLRYNAQLLPLHQHLKRTYSVHLEHVGFQFISLKFETRYVILSPILYYSRVNENKQRLILLVLVNFNTSVNLGGRRESNRKAKKTDVKMRNYTVQEV